MEASVRSQMSETTISVVSSKSLLEVFGACDQHVKKIREALDVKISARDGMIHVEGETLAVSQATGVLEQLQTRVNKFGALAPDDVDRALSDALNGRTHPLIPAIEVYSGRQVTPRTSGQTRYVSTMAE